MENIQLRIGRILSAFCLFAVVYNIVKSINNCTNVLNLSTIPFFFYTIIFAYSGHRSSYLLRVLQVLILFIEGLFTTYLGETFFGLSIIFVSIVLMKEYGLFDKHIVLKGLGLSTILFLLFCLFPLSGEENKFLRSFSWIVFILVYCILFWAIFSEEKKKVISKVIKKEESLRDQLNRVIMERDKAMELNESFLSLVKELNENMQNLYNKREE